MRNRQKSIDELMAEGTTLDRALQEGVRQALARHKKLGESVAVWRDGKVVVLQPEQIPEHPANGDGQDPENLE